MINNTFLKFTFSIILIAILTACSNKADDKSQSGSDEITINDLKEKIAKQEEEFTLIDVRMPDEFKDGNIEGSVCIPKDSLESKISNDAFWEEEFMYAPADSSQIILYSKSGIIGTSAVETLKKLGFKNVVNLEGGYELFTSNIKRDKLM